VSAPPFLLVHSPHKCQPSVSEALCCALHLSDCPTGRSVRQEQGSQQGSVIGSCCCCAVQASTYICEYQDFMNYHLTGYMTASISNVSVRWHYNSTRGECLPLTTAAKVPQPLGIPLRARSASISI
jgi:hypothetical protein